MCMCRYRNPSSIVSFTILQVYSSVILPNSTIIVSLLVSVICAFCAPIKFHSHRSNPPTITSHTQFGDIVTAVSEWSYLPVTDTGRGIYKQSLILYILMNYSLAENFYYNFYFAKIRSRIIITRHIMT